MAEARWRSVARRLQERPVLTTALMGLVFVVYQCVWISKGRFLGGLDTDEGSGVATALEFHRALAVGLGDFERAVFQTGAGPMVPVLSLPFIVVFGRSATSPMFIQPVLVALSAIGVAGTVRHLATRNAALLAGFLTLAMPALITSSRTNQYSNGVGAFLCLATWALLASDRGRRLGPMVAFGAACGAMIISRTMAVSFLPAVALAVLVVVAWRERRVWRNLAIALLAVAVVAGRWWWMQWDYVSTYLLDSGYGGRSVFYGENAIAMRFVSHAVYLLRDFRAMLPLGSLVVALAAIEFVRHLRSADRRAFLQRHRDLLGVWAIVFGITAALLSSSNRGYWFSTPVDSLLIAGVVAAGSLVLRKVPTRPTLALAAVLGFVPVATARLDSGMSVGVGVIILCVAVAILAVPGLDDRVGISRLAAGVGAAAIVASIPLVGPSAGFGRDASLRAQLVGGIEPYLPTIYGADARLMSPDYDTRKRAAAEWAEAGRELDRRLVPLEQQLSVGGNGTLGETVAGARGLFDTNAIAVARELGPLGVRRLLTPNTFEVADADLEPWLEPRMYDGAPRVLIVVEGRTSPFPDSLGWVRFVELAEQRGWKPVSEIPLPDRGRVVIYTHPSTYPDA